MLADFKVNLLLLNITLVQPSSDNGSVLIAGLIIVLLFDSVHLATRFHANPALETEG